MQFQYSFEQFKHLVRESPPCSPLQSIQRSNVTLKQLFEEYQEDSEADYILYLDASHPQNITIIQPPCSLITHDLSGEVSFAAQKDCSSHDEQNNLANIITTSLEEESKESLLLNISNQLQDLTKIISSARSICRQSGNNQKMSTETQSSRKRSAAFSSSSSNESVKQGSVSDSLLTESISQAPIIGIEIFPLEQIRTNQLKQACFKKPLREMRSPKRIVRTSKKKELRHRVK